MLFRSGMQALYIVFNIIVSKEVVRWLKEDHIKKKSL